MLIESGIAFAFIAMLCWGFGDFLIQKSARKIGDSETLFVITFIGVIILAPFVSKEVISGLSFFQGSGLYILLGCRLALFTAALLQFESLRVGKISVVESIYSTEIITSVFLAFFILKERLNLFQSLLIILLIFGLILVSIKEKGKFSFKHFFVEKGVLLAFSSAIIMGGANFLMGVGARNFDPIFANFVACAVMATLTFAYLLYKNKVAKMVRDVRSNFSLILTMSISDNVAWVAFAFAMSLAPIGIAVALSESYIIITVILGFFVNKEKLQFHQKIGLAFALFGAITLAIITT